MENRDRDKLSRSTGSSSAGKVNRDVSSRRGQEENANADFGQKIGQSERQEPDSRRSEGIGSSGMKGSSKGDSSSSRSGSSSGNGRP